MLAFLANRVLRLSFPSCFAMAAMATALALSLCRAQEEDPFGPAQPSAAAKEKPADESKTMEAVPEEAGKSAESQGAAARSGLKDAPIEILSNSERNILLELDKPTSIEFVEEPLADVVNDLKDQHGIEIQLDDRALDDAGIPRDTPITLPRMNNLPLRSVLGLLRRKYGVHYLVQADMLLITSKDVAESEENLVRMVYPVGDLVTDADDDTDYGSVVKAIVTTIDASTWRTYPRPSHMARPQANPVAPAAPQAAPSVGPQTEVPHSGTLHQVTGGFGGMGGGMMGTGTGGIGLIADSPGGAAGGPGTVVVVESSQSLVIAQTREVHEKVRDLLKSLRVARKIADDAADDE